MPEQDNAERASAGFPRGPKLGVDVGTVRVGLAACDPDGILASPVKTLRRDTKKNSDIGVLVRTAAELGAVEVFVGLPRTLSGKEGASAEMATDYAQELADRLARSGSAAEVRLVDERLTTVSAHRSLHQAGLSSREHRKVVDQVAAVSILQHAIDTQKARGTDVGRQVTPASEQSRPASEQAGASGAADPTTEHVKGRHS